jgi:hypothetical protein
MSTGPDGAAWTLICGFGESLRPSFKTRKDGILAKGNAQPREKFLQALQPPFRAALRRISRNSARNQAPIRVLPWNGPAASAGH